MTRATAGLGIALALIALALALAVAGCGGAGTLSPSPSPAPSVSAPGSPVTGVLLKVDSAGLSSVTGFTLRTADGLVLDFTIGTLENGAEFPPGHLTEHLASAAPVRVFFRVDGGRLVVYRIEDAA